MVVFSGRVQGVGFRYSVCNVAESHDVCGYVRNMMDGTVEVLAEGSEQELVDFLNGIKGSHVGRFISGVDVRWAEASGRYRGFGVQY